MAAKSKVNGIRVIPTEDEEQTALFSWAAVFGGGVLRWMFHIPNGGKRSKAEAARFRAMGVRPGVSDVFLPLARGNYHGLWIEMKALDGRVSGEQERFLRDMRREGYAAGVCYGMEQAKAAVELYLAGLLAPIPADGDLNFFAKGKRERSEDMGPVTRRETQDDV